MVQHRPRQACMASRPDKAPWLLQEERGFPDINIITEKVAFQGITRFEDRGRMPLGSVFNVTSFSARILSQAMYNPKVHPRPPPHRPLASALHPQQLRAMQWQLCKPLRCSVCGRLMTVAQLKRSRVIVV